MSTSCLRICRRVISKNVLTSCLVPDLASWWSGLRSVAKVTLSCALLAPAATCLVTGNSDSATVVVSDQAASAHEICIKW